jgi:hypothetical protein
VASRLSDERAVAALDEQFHELLVVATGNLVMAQMHREVTERIRIIRRLDFTDTGRVTATYDEHAQLLRSILRRKGDHACLLLKSHIETSKRAVRRITLHRLFMARNMGGAPMVLPVPAAVVSAAAPGGPSVAGRGTRAPGRGATLRLAGQTV